MSLANDALYEVFPAMQITVECGSSNEGRWKYRYYIPVLQEVPVLFLSIFLHKRHITRSIACNTINWECRRSNCETRMYGCYFPGLLELRMLFLSDDTLYEVLPVTQIAVE